MVGQSCNIHDLRLSKNTQLVVYHTSITSDLIKISIRGQERIDSMAMLVIWWTPIKEGTISLHDPNSFQSWVLFRDSCLCTENCGPLKSKSFIKGCGKGSTGEFMRSRLKLWWKYGFDSCATSSLKPSWHSKGTRWWAKSSHYCSGIMKQGDKSIWSMKKWTKKLGRVVLSIYVELLGLIREITLMW